MRISRAALALLPVLALTGCGSGSAAVPSADQAQTIACRGYVLDVGDSDVVHLKELFTSVPYADDVENDSVLATIRTAANAAGRTTGLSDKDFELFHKVLTALDALQASVTSDFNGTSTIGTKVIIALQKATDAVHKRCY